MSKGNNHLKLEDMKYDKGQLTEADIKERQGFWNKKELEKCSKKQRELLSAIKDMTYEEITAIRYTMWARPSNKQQLIVWQADKKDLEYALQIAPKTFKVNQSNNI